VDKLSTMLKIENFVDRFRLIKSYREVSNIEKWHNNEEILKFHSFQQLWKSPDCGWTISC
jgi:hypothetical protein